MDKKNDHIVDELTKTHNDFLENKTSDLFFKREKLKKIIEGGKRTNKSIKLTKLVTAYTLMVVIFTFFSFMIINHFYSKKKIKVETELNMSLFLKDSPGAILLSYNDEVIK